MHYFGRGAAAEPAAPPRGPEPILKITTSAVRIASAFQLLRTRISTNAEAFIPAGCEDVDMRLRPQGPRIAVPNWLIEWSKSRDLFLSLAHNPWVYRPN